MTDIMKSLFDPDTVQEMYEKSLRREGREEGEEERGYKDAERIVEAGLADEKKACELLGVDLDGFKKYLEENKNE